jgi:hypothetical protein
VISINVKHNIDAVIQQLDQQFKRQVPFATAKAITDTAKDVQRTLTAEIDRVFDRPVPFTQRAIGMTYANKSTLTARVFIKDVQAQYLRLEVTGGLRTPKNRALVMPAGVPLNQYGNMPRNKLRQLLARKDVFSGKVRGIGGIWQRDRKGGLKLLVAYEPQAMYKRRFPFYDIAKAQIERTLLPNLRASLAAAMASAR